VPYRNIAQYTPDLMAGTVQLGFQWLPNVTAAIKSGGAKALAVAAKQRMTALPEVPTTVEAGLPAYQASGWFMMLAPKGTPKEIVARLNQELNAAMSDPAVRARITEQGAETLVLSPQEVAAFLSSEVAKWRDIIHKAGIEPIQ
jgi:tripartite-type tricarboxylate transporter receptor subunit TctC